MTNRRWRGDRSACSVEFLILMIAVSAATAVSAQSTDAAKTEMPVLLVEDFEKGADRWTPTDPAAWRVDRADGKSIYNLHADSDFKPPHTSPFNRALLKDIIVSDFELTADVRSTIPDYGHRDVCIFFGYQDPAHFYYAHLGKRTDDHANQIFIVDGRPRVKISEKTTDGTPWTDEWHKVRVVRRAKSGTIEIYFDDMKTPVMTATNKRFVQGQIGIGSFDDTAEWDDIELRGVRVRKSPAKTDTDPKTVTSAEEK